MIFPLNIFIAKEKRKSIRIASATIIGHLKNTCFKLIASNKKILANLLIKNKTKKIKFILPNCFFRKKTTDLVSPLKNRILYFNFLQKNNSVISKKTYNANDFLWSPRIRIKKTIKKFSLNSTPAINQHAAFLYEKPVALRHSLDTLTKQTIFINNVKFFKKNSPIILNNYYTKLAYFPYTRCLSYTSFLNTPTSLKTKKEIKRNSKHQSKFYSLNNAIKKIIHYRMTKKNAEVQSQYQRNEAIVNPLSSLERLPHCYATKLAQKILYLNNTLKEATLTTSIAKKPETQNNKINKLDKKLTSIKEALDTLITINKQSEIEKSRFKLFEKRKTYSDFI